MSPERRTPRWLALLTAVACGAMGAAARAETPALGEAAHQAYRAGQVDPDEGSARRHFQDGIDLARQALAHDPDDPAGLLWLAANLGGEALTHGKIYALRVIGEIESTLLHLERTNPAYDHAAAARVLGRLYHKAPAIISVGSNDKAAAYLGEALTRAPDFPGNWAFAADFYLDRHDCPRARPLAERLRAAGNLDGYGFDAREWRDIAGRVVDDCR